MRPADFTASFLRNLRIEEICVFIGRCFVFLRPLVLGNSQMGVQRCFITGRKRSLGQGNIFRSVCQEFCPGGGGVDTPRSDGYCCGRYASYWNAFLFFHHFHSSRLRSFVFTVFGGSLAVRSLYAALWKAMYFRQVQIQRSKKL